MDKEPITEQMIHDTAVKILDKLDYVGNQLDGVDCESFFHHAPIKKIVMIHKELERLALTCPAKFYPYNAARIARELYLSIGTEKIKDIEEEFKQCAMYQ